MPPVLVSLNERMRAAAPALLCIFVGLRVNPDPLAGLQLETGLGCYSSTGARARARAG